MNKLLRYLLDIIFPNRCPFCDNYIKWNKIACDSCIDKLSYVDDNICRKCGKNNCACGNDLFYDYSYIACYYEGLVTNGIINLKINNALNAAEFFSYIIYSKILGDEKKYDLVIAVPMSLKKQRDRGYNQAEEFAKFIAKKINSPINTKILFKIDSNIEQHKLNSKQRQENVINSYYIKKDYNLSGKNILLCDDVITTGSTINECSRLLKESGATRVDIAVCSTTKIKN